MHEHAIQHPPGINIQAERNVADPENGLHFRQLLLDAFYRLQSLYSSHAVVFLPGRDWQRKRVKNHIHRPNAIFLGSQIEDTFSNSNFLVRGERHAVFINGECDYRRAVSLGHRQHF